LNYDGWKEGQRQTFTAPVEWTEVYYDAWKEGQRQIYTALVEGRWDKNNL